MRKLLIAFALLILVIPALLYFELPFNLIRPVFHADLINYYSDKYDLDPLLVTAIIKTESNFLIRARSHRGATGLMQLLPSTARELAVELNFKNPSKLDLEDPKVNIHIGTYYIHKLRQEFHGNTILALAAYNAGAGKVRTWYLQNPMLAVEITDIPYKETRNYVKNIMATYSWLKKIQHLQNLIRRKKA